MPRFTRALLTAAAIAAASLLSAAPAAAAALADAPPGPASSVAGPTVGSVRAGVDDFSFSSLDVDYTLGRDDDGTSTLKVTETFVADFPDTDQNHGMRRQLPDSYNGQPLEVEVLSVTDENGDVRPFDTDDDDGTFSITSRSDHYLHGQQTFVFTYTMRHVTWRFSDTDADEFYWDVNGSDWSQPFGSVTVTLHVPAALSDAMTGRQACYQGAYGSTDTCEITTTTGDDGAATVRATASGLDARENMTIAVGFASGTFALFDDSPWVSPWGWVQVVGLLVIIAAVVSAIIVRMRKLRDAPGRPTIIAEYTPPDGVDALLSAVLLGKTSKAIPAAVLEQAVAGSIQMIEGEKRLFGSHKMQARLVKSSLAIGVDGRMLLAGMFGDVGRRGATFTFGGNNTRFAKAAQKVLKWGTAEIKRRHWRRKIDRRARNIPVLLAFAGLILTMGAGIMALASYVSPAVPAVIMACGAGGFVASLLLITRRPLSAAGAEIRDHLEGLRQFIEWAEADRIRMLQSPGGAERVPVDTNDPQQMLKLYEKLLPYAVVFGQEKEWAEQLATMYPTGEGPYWYAGNVAAFNAATFAAGIGSLTATAAASSATSGGSGGGGFSGGGGGGGGGGGV